MHISAGPYTGVCVVRHTFPERGPRVPRCVKLPVGAGIFCWQIKGNDRVSSEKKFRTATAPNDMGMQEEPRLTDSFSL